MNTMHQHRVVIVGGGFGGLNAATALRRAPLQVTLLDRRNFHLFQPLLYQVATGALSPANIAAPLRAILKRSQNTEVLLAEATGFDVENRKVILSDGEIPYDTLILAVGVRHHYFGHSEWEADAPGLKTIEDATEIRRQVLLAFEAAERETDPARIRELLTFVVVGAGPTGVELAGAVGEIARYTLKNNFRRIDPSTARIILLEGTDRVLNTYPPDLSAAAARSLERLGVTVRTNTLVTDVRPDCVMVRAGEGEERIPAHTVLWAAGVQGSPLAKALADATGAELDRAGRVIVQPDLTIPDHPEILVIGDLAHYAHQHGQPLPGVAQVAMQQGRYAARLIQSRLRGETPPPPFRYRDLGNMATIGRNAAVADLGRLRFKGWIGWIMWLFVHLVNLVQFENRVLVLFQWGWNYLTRNRAARLITGENPLPLKPTPVHDSSASEKPVESAVM
jgi:NADH:ubiquinone reductase (H+-translocating)